MGHESEAVAAGSGAPRRVTDGPHGGHVGRVLGVLFGTGCGAAIPAIVLDRTAGSHKGVALAVACLALATVATLQLLRSRRRSAGSSSPRRRRRALVQMHVNLALTLVVVATAVWSGNGGTTAVAAMAFFSWPSLVAFAFLPPRHAWPYLPASLAAAMATIALSVHQTPLSCAVSVLVTCSVATATAGHLRTLLVRSFSMDPLTELPNRHALAALLGRETARAERRGRPLSVAVIDLDGFKQVNDAGGHEAGDELLQMVAARWRRALAPGDTLVRSGGDEFVVVVSGRDAGRCAETVAALRRAGGQPCSIGVAERLPGETGEDALARADVALYEAKRAGRDRVVTAAPGSRPAAVLPRRLANLRGRLASLVGRLPSMPRRRRLAGNPPTLDRRQPAVRARMLGLLYIGAGVTAVPGVVITSVPHADVAATVVSSAMSAATGLGQIGLARRLGERLPMWVVYVFMALALVAVPAGAAMTHDGLVTIINLGITTWAFIYLAALFPWRTALLWATLCAISTTVAVLTTVTSNPVGVALLEVSGAAGAGLVVGYVALLVQRRADVDALTQLPNRRALDDILARELSIARRSGAPLSVAVVDVDHLKAVNDALGHPAGDEVLCSFAATWTRQLRVSDRLVRYGGDEFVLLLPGCDLGRAEDIMERLRSSGGPACSVGVTQVLPDDTQASVLARADAALYGAKARGRGRVVAHAAPAAVPEAG